MINIKAILLSLLGLISFLPGVAQTLNEDLKFEERVFDFGNVDELGGKITHIFKVKNTGKEPIALVSSRTGCNCVEVKLPREEIKPGATAKVAVTYNPNYRPGPFSKEIAVMSSGSRYNRIWIKGNVIAGKHPVEEKYRYGYGDGLWMNLKLLSFGSMPKGGEKSVELRFANGSEKPMTVRFEPSEPNFGLTMPAECTLEPNGEAKVDFGIKLKNPFSGRKTTKIYPIVNGKKLSMPLNVLVIGFEN